MTNTETNQILAKSENCMEKLNRWRDKNGASYMRYSAIIVALIIICCILIFSIEISEQQWGSFLLECIVMIGMYKPIKKILDGRKDITNQYNKYELLCRTETLIADIKQLYGRTEYADFSILYDDIRDVIHITQPMNNQKINLKFENDIIEIITFDNRKYRFLSFSNTNELAEIIKRNIK